MIYRCHGARRTAAIQLLAAAWAICGSWGGALLFAATTSVPTGDTLPPITLVLDGSSAGKVFEGIGATSGGGASSRLLVNYPEPQRSQILDFLFKPHYGASLQALKVEIGSDGNAGMGAEASHARRRGEDDFTRGYEWWLMTEAKRRNPSIKLLALAWNFPAWLGSANSQATADYLVAFLTGAKRVHGLDIDYIGIWNETPMDPAFIKRLRKTLDAAHLHTRIIADDLVNDWSIADKMAADPQLRAAVDVIATHYPRTLSPVGVRERAAQWGKSLWSSEDGPWDDAWGAPGMQSTPLAELLNRNYIQAGITSTNVWNLATGYYDILDYTNAGLMRANHPWSGHYELTSPLWVVAHTTQFAQPGWRYIDTASALLSGGGSVVTLHDGAQYSVIAETISAHQPQRVEFVLRGGLARTRVQIWRSTATKLFQPVGAIEPADGRWALTLEPASVYSMTTTTGQQHGGARPPPDMPFPIPYHDGFESYRIGTDSVRYFAEQNGAYEVAPCASGRTGQCLNQVVETPPIWWTYGADATRLGTPTVIGDPRWRDYRVSADVLVRGDGYAGILGRVGRVSCCDGTLDGYQFRLYGSGKWQVRAGSSDEPLASGAGDSRTQTSAAQQTVAQARPWRRLELAFHGDRITASIDGRPVVTLTDTRFPVGLAGLSGGWNPASYDDFAVGSVAPGVAVISAPPVPRVIGPPEPPKLFVPVPTRNAVRLSWSAVTGATAYRILTRIRQGEAPHAIDVGAATHYTVTTLTNGVTYRFQVVALNHLGVGKPSEEQSASPSDAP